MTESEPRLAELIGGLSLATDLAAGFGLETALRTSLLAVELGRAIGADGDTLGDLYWTGLLRFLGCSSFAHESAAAADGDDLAFSRELAPADGGSLPDIVRTAWRGLGRGRSFGGKLGAVARLLRDPKGPVKFATAHCDQAVKLAGRLGMSERVVEALGQIYERWDGRGQPHHRQGAAIALGARVMRVAWEVEIHRSLRGADAPVEMVRRRRGGELDPEIADAFLGAAPRLLALVAPDSVWDAFLAAEPGTPRRLPPGGVGEVALAFAHFVDLKSPFTLAHSTGVAQLASAAAAAIGLPAHEVEQLRVAALLHDLGRVSVPNGIWDKPGALNQSERERVRQHAYQTERILAQSPLTRPYAQLAAADHERSDGSGYHRGLPASAISRGARLLAAADVYTALREDRAHRAALGADAAAETLVAEARAGRLDREAVEAVLAQAGHRAARVRGAWPAGLSDREVEVLGLLARGLSNKEIGKALFISPKTVQHHIAHIYEKTGVSTRAAAALYAVEQALLEK